MAGGDGPESIDDGVVVGLVHLPGVVIGAGAFSGVGPVAVAAAGEPAAGELALSTRSAAGSPPPGTSIVVAAEP